MRALTLSEWRQLRRYFGAGLKYRRLRVGVLPGRLRRAMAPLGGLMLFPRECFLGADPRRPLTLDRLRVRAALVHEAVHVWQRQHGVWVTLAAIPLQIRYRRGEDVYRYDGTPTDPERFLALFRRANVEQQGKIVEDLVRAEAAGVASGKWRLIRAWLTC